MLRPFLFFIVSSLSATITYAISIERDGIGTKVIFESSDFEFPHGKEQFENGWLNRTIDFRPGCYINTLPFALSYQASIDVAIQYQACWRDVIDNISDLSEISLARFDLAYQDANTEPHRKSQFLDVADIGNLNWHSAGDDFIHARAESSGVKTIHIKNVQIPASSQVIRTKMCAIAPKSTIRVEKIELTISDPSQFLPAARSISDGPLSCFDSGLFLANCQLAETVLEESELLEQEYDVNFTFACRGHQIDFALDAGASSIVLEPKEENQIATVTGNGLRIIDRNPEKTRKATFDHGCKFKINSVTKKVSPRQRQILADKKETLESALKDSQSAAEAFVDLTILVRVIEAIQSALDLAEKSLAVKFKAKSDLSFEKLLSKQQIESLKKIMQEKNILTRSDEQYDHFKKIEESSQQKLRELLCLVKNPDEKGGSYDTCN